MYLIPILLLTISGVLQAALEKESFENYHVIRVSAPDSESLEFLEDATIPTKLSIWRYGRSKEGLATATFHVHPDLVASILQKLDERGLQYDIVNTNLQRDIDLERIPRDKSSQNYTYYYDFDELQAWLQEQVDVCGTQCSLINIGNSYELRPLNVIKLTGADDPTCLQKPAIFIEAGTHSQEWIAISTAQYIIDKLITEYSTVGVVTSMRDDYDWYILPATNPDGYVHTWDTNRMWRKNRTPNFSSTCVGTNINRNFDFMWMMNASSSDPCADNYAGAYAFSEPEAMHIAKFLTEFVPMPFDLLLSIHSYDQVWVTPWGHSYDLPTNYDELERVGLEAVKAIFDASGQVYDFGTSASLEGDSSGTFRDWAMDFMVPPYVYSIELRSEDSYVLPEEEIEPTGAEIWAALQSTMVAMGSVRPPTCVTPAL